MGIAQQLNRGKVMFGGLVLRGGLSIKKITSGTVSGVDPPSITNGTTGSVDIAIPGVAAGDIVVLFPPTALNPGLVYFTNVPAADKTAAKIMNTTAAPIDAGAGAWVYLWLDLT